MSKHTAGDWQIGQQGYVGINRDDARNWKGVCQVLGYGPEHEANARLIAAAPEMFSILQAMLVPNADTHEVFARIEAVMERIAKATAP